MVPLDENEMAAVYKMTKFFAPTTHHRHLQFDNNNKDIGKPSPAINALASIVSSYSDSFDAFDCILTGSPQNTLQGFGAAMTPIENSLEYNSPTDSMEVGESAQVFDESAQLRKRLFNDNSASDSAASSAEMLLHSAPALSPPLCDSPPRSPSTDSGKGGSDEEGVDDEDLEQPFMELVSNLIEVQGICHINLLEAQFVITHNEETNDFFLDLVPSYGSSESVLQVIFRFPENRNGIVEIFTSSYGQWARPGRLVYHDDSPPCTSTDSYGSCGSRYSSAASTVASTNTDGREETISAAESENETENDGSNEVEEMNCENDHSLQTTVDDQKVATQCYCSDSRKNSVCNENSNANPSYDNGKSTIPKRPIRQQHWHLQLHVYEDFYTIELNGRVIERFNHRLAFQKVQRID